MECSAIESSAWARERDSRRLIFVWCTDTSTHDECDACARVCWAAKWHITLFKILKWLRGAVWSKRHNIRNAFLWTETFANCFYLCIDILIESNCRYLHAYGVLIRYIDVLHLQFYKCTTLSMSSRNGRRFHSDLALDNFIHRLLRPIWMNTWIFVSCIYYLWKFCIVVCFFFPFFQNSVSPVACRLTQKSFRLAPRPKIVQFWHTKPDSSNWSNLQMHFQFYQSSKNVSCALSHFAHSSGCIRNTTFANQRISFLCKIRYAHRGHFNLHTAIIIAQSQWYRVYRVRAVWVDTHTVWTSKQL